MSQNNNKRAKRILLHILLILLSVLFIFPFLWMFMGAFKNDVEVIKMPPTLLPSKFSFDNFRTISKLFPVGRFLLNSVFVAFSSTILQLLFCAMAAYVFAKIKFTGREVLFTLFLITMMVPRQLTMITLYRIFVNLHLQNSYLGLILPSTYNALGIFLMRQHIRTIPDSFAEAATVDGASHFKIFFKLILPLCKPALATVGILGFMESWNSFLWPLIITSSTELATLPLGLSKLQGRWTTAWNLLMAGNVISTIPILMVYLFAQKYFIKSLAHSGIKG
ncbi:MAG TPA: carbohydrate ABC transporter permease [Clostridiaceae bacterium]|nr:carbohydrate ABC transporter permease [Clostridiaceae bacterium]HHV99097.1 carbohydrate ABC transporter permease [Clostridiaceae bacterium]